MTEHHPADRPGHLDIDAVSAFIDRDLRPDDLATIEFHLHECPPCYREVLEIRTTVVLLTALPQYTPRRSFCLGHEHARAGRRRTRVPRGLSWAGPFASSAYPASATASVTQGESGRGAGWLSGLQAAAMVVGALLLLVTTSDLIGMPPQPADWLSEPEAPIGQIENLSAPPPAMVPANDSGRDSETASESEPAAANTESSFTLAGNDSGGTTSGDSASEEVLEEAETTDTAPSDATNAALAAVTRAVPTPVSGLARSPGTATDGADAPAATAAQPSRLRLAQLALAFALAWLVVSIVGLRWVRGLRRARD
ncbi:MAG: zf-HC2 domain-containing protein [Chloroflexi bacterium]|nr:zf-HC2 domain-containing protein [Chloroflexota bacterium]